MLGWWVVVIDKKRKEKNRTSTKNQTGNYNRVGKRFKKRESHPFKKGCSAGSCTCNRFPFFCTVSL